MTRLEELHKAYEDNLKVCHKDWVSVYNEHPSNSRIVDVWIMENGVNRFGYQARFDHIDAVWMSPEYSYRNWNIIAWKDI